MPAASPPVTEFPLVSVDIAILDAAGTTVKSLSCEWTEPQEDDRQCLRFQSDPQVAFEAIEEAGGVRIEKHTTSDGDSTSTCAVYSKRADGTWLIRSRGTSDGKPMHFGTVCTADGQKCVRWDADGAKAARKSVQAAAVQAQARSYRAAATTAGVTPAMPRALGWNGAAALPGTSGSTQRVPEPLHASLPRLAVYVVDERRAGLARLAGDHRR